MIGLVLVQFTSAGRGEDVYLCVVDVSILGKMDAFCNVSAAPENVTCAVVTCRHNSVPF